MNHISSRKLFSAFLVLFLLLQSLSGILFLPKIPKAYAATAWLSTYTHRVKIPVASTVAGAQTDYQMSIVLHSKSGTNTAGDIYLNGNLQDATAFNDIRFTNADGATLRNFWIQKVEDETGGRKATVWVKLDTPASGTTNYYLYYGKAGDTSASSYDNTFTKDYGESGLVGLWHMDEQTPVTELLTDGGLETWTNSTTLTNWTNDSASTGVRDITQESTTKQSGSYSLKLAATANLSTNFGIYQNITTVNNQQYQVNFYQYYSSRTVGTLKVEAYDNTHSVSLGSQSIAVAGTALSFTSFRFTSTNTTNVRIKIYLNSETTGTAYIDDLSVKQSSNTLTDSSSSSPTNTGTIYGASRTATDGGQWSNRSDVVFSTGSALQFEGTDDYVDAGNGASLNITGDFTYSAWYKLSAITSATQDILGESMGLNDYTSPIQLAVTSTGISRIWMGSGTAQIQVADVHTDLINTWYHISATISGTSIKLYKNGILVNTGTFTGTRQVVLNKLTIGAASTTSRFFNGTIDEVRIYNRALSSDEISRLYIRSKYASTAPALSTPDAEEQLALGVSSQSPTLVNFTNATLNGYLTGFGGDTSATVYFKYGLTSDNLNQTTATQAMSDYGSFTQAITGLTADTTYYFQAVITDSAGTAYGATISFQTAALDTDYYRTIINTNGSLTFTNKSTGAVILNSSPQYNLNYGSTSNTTKNPTNNSFETDSNSDGIPDNWTVDKSYIRLSTEHATDGTKSLKFNMSTTDTDHRRAYSSLLTPVQDKYYTISIDSYLSSFTSGSATVYVAYYNTVDGTGTMYLSLANNISTTTGSWHTSAFDWTPPASAKSFQILLYSDENTIATVYFDNVTVTEKTYNYTTTSGTISHTLTTNGASSTITAIDDSNSYAKITHQYELNTNSPYIKYTASLQYKQNVDVTEERFDFTVPDQSAQVMTRDLALASFDTSQTYWSDLYTPKVVKFTSGLSFLGSDTMDSMRLQASGSNSQLSFYSDFKDDHPHFYYVKNVGATTYVSETKRLINDTYSASVTFAIDTTSTLNYLIKPRQPYTFIVNKIHDLDTSKYFLYFSNFRLGQL
jgi:hypothetical protein